jgi:molybdenum cofactor sulfurtransferase
LDLAKAASTGPVSLRQLNPDFACLSFYKVFGAPTGLGCLLVKRSILEAWWDGRASEDFYYGGGAVDLLLPQQNITFPRASPSPLAALASGTCHFRGICELAHGLDVVARLGGMVAIRRHTMSLAYELAQRLRSLQHANGNSVVDLYGAWSNGQALDKSCDPESKGPTVTFNLRRQDDSYVGYNEVAKLAALNRPCPIQLRVGCFCNPGACQQALKLSEDQILDNHRKTGHVCGDDIDIINDWPTGAVRASFGKDSTWEDLDALVAFIERVFVATGCKLETSWDGSPRQVLVEEQYVFPIKSCAAQRVPVWQMNLTSSRLAFDREFALVDSSGTAMRLQKYPKMTFIEPSISLGASMMTVRAPNMPTLEVSLNQPDEPAYGEGVVKVCGNKCGGILWGDMAVSEWFSDFLQVQCWLARFSEGSYELPPGKPTQQRDRSVAFANEQPLLLISKHAVDLLNEVLESRDEKHVTSRHFRPNFVVRLAGEQHEKFAHAEDGWKRVEMQNQKACFDVVGQCGRCSMVDVDPRSGMKGHTLRALSDYRRQNGQISFGIFLKGSASSSGGEPIWVREGDVFRCE